MYRTLLRTLALGWIPSAASSSTWGLSSLDVLLDPTTNCRWGKSGHDTAINQGVDYLSILKKARSLRHPVLSLERKVGRCSLAGRVCAVFVVLFCGRGSPLETGNHRGGGKGLGQERRDTRDPGPGVPTPFPSPFSSPLLPINAFSPSPSPGGRGCGPRASPNLDGSLGRA